MAPNVYGAGHFRKAGSPGNQYDFLQQFRANGGKFFDDSMKAQLASDAGVKTLTKMIAANKASIPGNNELDAVALWAAWLQGKVAMIYSWPPTGRMTAGYSQSDKAINFIPQSTIADKVGLRGRAGGNPEHATGYNKALAADSANPDAAYLFMQWATSPPVSLARVHAALRAARSLPAVALTSRTSTARSGPTAKDYLVNLNNSANVGLLDMIMPGWQDYALSLDRMCTSVWAGDRSEGGADHGRGRMGRHDRTPRRRFPEGVLRGVQEAAGLLGRPHGREDGHGGEARLRLRGSAAPAAVAPAQRAN